MQRAENKSIVPKLCDLLKIDPILNNFIYDIEHRYSKFREAYEEIERNEKNGFDGFTTAYKQFGLIPQSNKSITCKEWVPSASKVSLVGDFNNWDTTSHPLKKEDYGMWTLTIPPAKDGSYLIKDGSKYKLFITTADNRQIYRISPWTRYAIQNESTKLFETIFWNPSKPYCWKHSLPSLKKPSNKGLRIYETHIGISSEDYKVASYSHFREKVLPHIIYLGYNAIQLMAVMEHAFYASFGYQVTNYFAVSSRYGTPDELKELIDTCHKHGIRVLLDIIHGHACKNVDDGLNQFDGTNGCFFHDNGRGYHDLWDSRLFDLSQYEVKRFLLSNLRWFVDEYRFDGFRFDGVTSMLYHHHGNGVGFSGNYSEYFGTHVDLESITYFQLANSFLKKAFPNIIIIAEEVSGMPALCRPVDEGGLGFDYRLAMALPDMWIKLLKEVPDDNWNMWSIVWTLINRRHGENHVAYAESHDQSLVGDKTLAFWLMDQEMYWNMSYLTPKSLIIDRGMALHKMIRLITMALGGEAYLTFMGNEFGHPEWLDFPRAGNNSSYHYSRRQWHLVHAQDLRYRFLNEFDRHMQLLEEKFNWLTSPQAYVSKHHEADKIIVFERGNLVWIFNFHPTASFEGYRVPVSQPKDLKIVLCSDDEIFDGHKRVDGDIVYPHANYGCDGMPYSFIIYIPSRVAIVLKFLDKTE